MAILVSDRPLVLTTRETFASPSLALSAQTAEITVTIPLPTSATPLAWTASGRLRIRIVVTLDGVRYECVGQTRGGIRASYRGGEIPAYVLTYRPPYGFFGSIREKPIRLGETSKTTYEGHVEIEVMSGTFASRISVRTLDAPAPAVRHHSSVAYDTSTDAQEVSGDGVLSLSHTASGSDRAAFAGVGTSSGAPPASTSVTYAGNAMTEEWDVINASSFCRSAGYRLGGDASVPTGSQTVTNTLAGQTDEHGLSVTTMTGVDGTTPVGTPVSATLPTGSTTTLSVTVGSVGADDMVIDSIYGADGSGFNCVVGADQTERTSEIISTVATLASSTQLGSAGGVMSWTFSNGCEYGASMGAIAFKPAAAAAASIIFRPNPMRAHLVR